MRSLAVLLMTIPAVALAGAPEKTTVGGGASTTMPAPIINGTAATEAEYPMTGGLLVDAELTTDFGDFAMQSFSCSSTLIAPDVVLLAAHCIDPKVYTYGYGDFKSVDFRWSRQADLTGWDGSTQDPEWPEDAVAAWDHVMHEDWDYSTLGMGLAENRDIALLFLDEAVLDVPFAYLATTDEATQIVLDTEVVVVGWGQQEATDGPFDPPPEGTFAEKQVGTSFISELNDVEFKVGEVVEDVRKCHGDSGGPSFMTVQTDSEVTLRLIGVTSHAYDESDCSETGGVDTRVDHYLEWIDEQLRERCEDGSRVWCDEAGIPAIPGPAEEIEDTDEPGNEDTGGDDEKRVACGCAMGGGSMAAGLLPVLVGLLAMRRRR